MFELWFRPKWEDDTWSDGSAHRTIVVSKRSSRKRFSYTAYKFEEKLGGNWTTQLDGGDQIYWDLSADGGKITLHQEHYLGISIFVAADLGDEHAASMRLLERAFRVLR